MAEKLGRSTYRGSLQVESQHGYIDDDDYTGAFCCSGGCGRTGTYIAISILLERLKTEGVVDVFQTVRTLRLQRPGMIQTVVSTPTQK